MNSSIDQSSDSGSTFASTASHMPNLSKWLKAGAALAVAKTGTRVAGTLVRRNPGVLIAVGVVGAGVLAYRAYRRHADADAGAPRPAISGRVTRSNGTKVKVTATEKKGEEANGADAANRSPRARKAEKDNEGGKDTENANASAE